MYMLLDLTFAYVHVADLPTCPYLTIFVWKSAGSMDICTYFSKYRQSFQKVQKLLCKMSVSSLPGKLIVEHRWSYRWLTFAHFKPFLGLKYTAGPDWSKKLFKPMNIDFAFKALQKLAIFRYAVLNS